MSREVVVVDRWRLDAEGAAVDEAAGLAVIADVHLGYEWARGAGGEVVPAHSLAETIAKLDRLLARAAISRLVVAGDLVEWPRPCLRTAADVRELRRWLEGRGVALEALRGNHDPPGGRGVLEWCGWTIGHGDRPLPGERRLFGHHHPVLKAGGVTAPCFLVGPATIALPAFSRNAAGLDVVASALPEALRDPGLRCVAGLDGVLLDFGPRGTLAARLRPGIC